VLIAALLTMVLIGALAVAALFATNEDTKSGATGVDRDVALIAAESAIAMTMSDPEPDASRNYRRPRYDLEQN